MGILKNLHILLLPMKKRMYKTFDDPAMVYDENEIALRNQFQAMEFLKHHEKNNTSEDISSIRWSSDEEQEKVQEEKSSDGSSSEKNSEAKQDLEGNLSMRKVKSE